ncbi:DUF4476 domain-containing protein [Oscillospiraceae bacterium N12]|uniref:DUF4476 domain-containing protein n=1 Tax=Jilunia laotingensis TaxID=2763675 RepID=A0A926F183_9BACT|nr:DUF4476 domain-containing protein [Jilunia laotingensis]MBC8592223.1 DUF4476 domain-containing protein [Jilunia laotingensis]
MIRKLIFGFFFLLAAVSLKAFSLDGIRIESPGERIVVFVDGQRICEPTNSCFVANLRGNCRVEVYAAHRSDDYRREDALFDERVYCSVGKIKEIIIRDSHRPGHGNGNRPDRPGHNSHDAYGDPPMSNSSFEQFIHLMDKQNFTSDREELLNNALISSYFTTDQCIRLLKFYTFDSEKKAFLKKIYPRIADKPNFFRAIDQLTFSMDKNEINEFIKKYHENR